MLLQLFLAGLQLLHRGAQLFVDRLQLFVRVLHFLLTGLIFFDDRLESLLGDIAFTHHFIELRVLSLSGLSGCGRRRRRRLIAIGFGVEVVEDYEGITVLTAFERGTDVQHYSQELAVHAN
jgi:hypothetical protein